ncbi:MAG: hypothetical protein ABI665_28455, partial [Vicinamibacterales bacterium]
MSGISVWPEASEDGLGRAWEDAERMTRVTVIDAPVLTLSEYVRQAWHVVEPATPFVPGWHLDAICEHLEAVSRGEIRNLLINIPPRHAKSLIVSVFW